jgi:uncharacterized lipoprotein YmbA
MVCAVALLLSGCLLKPVKVSTRRFVLSPIPASEHPSAAREELSVGVGAVKMPTYLLKSSMALRKGTNEIIYLEDALWAERLDQSFQRTLAANLAILLPSDRVYLSAWEPGQVNLRLFVSVEEFDVDAQGRGTLIGSWRITAPGSDKPIKSGQTRLTKSGLPPRDGAQVIASTLSALTSEFSGQLAQELRAVRAVDRR